MKAGKAKQTQDEAAAVEVPDCFPYSLDLEVPVKEALRVVAAAGLDPAGFTKERRAGIGTAWEGWRLGGAAADVQERIGRLLADRADTQRRIEAAPGRPELKASLEERLKHIDGEVGGARELLEVAGEAVADNQVVRQRRIDRLRRDLDEARTLLGRYGAARLAAPDELEERVVRLEGEVAQAEARFAEGRALLEKLGAERRKHEAAARSALAATLERCAEALGRRAREAAQGQDLDLVEKFPHRLTSEAVGLYREAQAAAEIAGKLDSGSDVLGAFLNGAGERLYNVIVAAAGEQYRGVRESGMRAPRPSPDPAMREIY